MEICKAPTLQLKALNQHTHIMYIQMGKKEKKKDINKDTHKSITLEMLNIVNLNKKHCSTT